MRKIYTLALAMFILHAAHSQVLVTSSGGTSSATYSTLKASFDAVNTGTHTGAIDVALTGNTVETVSASLKASGVGGASYTSVYIHPSSASRSITGSIDGPLIELDGADFVTIAGMPGVGNALTITNASTSNTAGTSTIRLINDASNNTITEVTLQGASTGITTGTVLFGTGTTTGNDFNKIMSSNIQDAAGSFPVNAIYSEGSSTAGQENSNDSILNNNISNFFSPTTATVAVALVAGNTGWAISGNRFFQSAPRVYTTANVHRVIQVTSGKQYTISNNIIGYAGVEGAGVYQMTGANATRFTGFDVTAGTGATTNISGNVFTALTFTSTATTSTGQGVWCAINILNGDVNVGGMGANIIGATTGTAAIVVTTGSGGYTNPVNVAGGGNVTVTNNSIGAFSVVPGTPSQRADMNAIYVSAVTGAATISNNTIGNSTPNNITNGTIGVNTGTANLRAIGMLSGNTGTVNITGNICQNISQNSSGSLAFLRVIEYQSGAGTIANNIIRNISSNSTAAGVSTPAMSAIQVASGSVGINITNNTISQMSLVNNNVAGTAVLGIYLVSSNVSGAVIARNRMYGFTNASTSVSATVPGTICGVLMREASASNPITVANNMISFGRDQATNTAIIGIWNQFNSANNYTVRIYYNSVNIEGEATSGSQPSFGYYRGDFANVFTGPVVDIKNNIFTNGRSGGTGRHYAIANGYGAAGASSSTGWGTNASDYNILNAPLGTVGYWNTDQSFGGWQGISNNDEHSYSAVNVVYVDSASDLHLVTTTGTNAAADGKATPLAAVTTDYDLDPRNATTPDIGADEFLQGPLSVWMEYFRGKRAGNGNLIEWKSGCTSNSVTFSIERSNDGRKFSSIGSLYATQARCASPFSFTDERPVAGINYYRLKVTEVDGKLTYSMIIAVINNNRKFEIIGLMPTLVKGNSTTLSVSSSAKENLQLVIMDASGRRMYAQQVQVEEGSNAILLPLASLQAGSYVLSVYTNDGMSKTLRFIKQ